MRRYLSLALVVLLTAVLFVSFTPALASADTWMNVAPHGLDGNYRAPQSNAHCMAMNSTNLFVGCSDTHGGQPGCAVWRFDGAAWSNCGDNGLGDTSNVQARSMATFRGKLYVGTHDPYHGCQILRYNGGTSWTRVNDYGFGDLGNEVASTMMVFDDALYVGTWNMSDGTELWRFNGASWSRVGGAGSPWDADNNEIRSMAVYHDNLFVGTDNPSTGAEIWQYDGAAWTQVADGGFDSSDNEGASSMAVLPSMDSLFVGTLNGQGCEVWSYDDTGWNQVSAIGSGFGDPFNINATTMVAYGNSLVTGTYNDTTGSEIWSWDNHDPLTQIGLDSFDEQGVTPGPGFIQDFGVACMFMFGPTLYCGTLSQMACEVRRYDGGTEWPLIAPLGLAANQSWEVTDILDYNGQLHASTMPWTVSTEVWRQAPDGGRWSPAAPPGFGFSRNNAVYCLGVYGGDLYAGATDINSGGCGVWRWNGKNWAQVNMPGFGIGAVQPLCMTVYDDSLFVGVFTYGEASVWRFDGGTWQQANVNGFGKGENGVSCFAVFNGRLFAGSSDGEVFRWEGGTAWTQVNDEGFGEGDTSVKCMAVMGNCLYAGTINKAGGAVRKYDGTSWTKVAPNGFGDKTNEQVCSLAVLGGRLYAGTMRDGGCEVWAYDGRTWKQACSPGFGDANNRDAASMFSDGNDLYVGTYNSNSGCEIWKTSLDIPPSFYFAEGTTRPGFDPYFTIANPGSQAATVTLTYLKGDGKSATQNIAVAPHSRGTVHPADVLGVADDSAHDFATTVACTNGQHIIAERPMYFDYNGWPGGSDVVGATAPATGFHFAEGTTRPGFETYFTIANPESATASVTLTYMKGDGKSATQSLAVAPRSRSTVHPADVLGVADDNAHDFSAVVTCTNGKRIVAERPTYFDYKGWTGGTDVMGATSPSSNFYFAEGTTRPGFDPYFCVENPGDSNANVTLAYMKGDGITTLQNVAVGPRSRSTVRVRDVLGTGDDVAHDFSAKVSCTNGQNVVVERPMYFDYKGWPGGSDVIGAKAPAVSFSFAEGTTRTDFDTYFTIQNPGNSAANVTLTYMKGDGKTATQSLVVPATSRATVHPADVLGVGNDAAHDFSTVASCTNGRSIVVERPMYFKYMGKWTGGHDVVGFVP
jgi:hypothetical protein